VIRVHLPPLRERREDIPRLARHFLQVAARELGVEAKQLHPETDAALTRLAWPGNVRQLENTCRWLTVMAAGQEVLIQDLPANCLNHRAGKQHRTRAAGQLGDAAGAVGRSRAAFRSSKPAFRSSARDGAHAVNHRASSYAGP
jgi:two-component system nitrogen regulation response regulator GlnG